MSGSKLFVDTNILIFLLKGEQDIAKILNDKILVISVITELELKSLPQITKREANIIEQLIEDCEVVDLNREIKELVVEIRRKQKLKLPDAIIAASAKYAKLPVFTADKEFKKLKQQDVIIFEV